ncbi:DM13 and DOMON_DOH domain-containing protein skeletor isoform X3 [Anticarsia gemmatalis]|uniref:DM13 and DOMON_DOH domain-containing protein skeletor isoform X3 n=1 Tax=Anticarsia gemmatalis TaxID=129554 RepID=UPI003F757A17
MRPALALALLTLLGAGRAQVRYFGKEVGALSSLQHGVRGAVYAVDSRTLYVHDFHYDGEGPAAYFYVGTGASPRSGAGAVRLRDERGGSGPLRKYSGEHLTLSLPDGKTLRDYRWFSVYCDEYEVNFGDVSIPRALEYPRPAKVAGLRGVHAVSSDPIVVVDAQTILVPNFSYDGEAPDAKFWVGRGDKPSPQGIRIPDENGKEAPLRRYDKKTIVLTLPGELTVFDIGHFAVWCEAFTVNFGHVALPRAALASVPPSLKMLGVSPQSRNRALVSSSGGSSHGSSPPATTAPRTRPRVPIARVDATTYRPAARLRPGASLLASLQHEPHDRTNPHRRANTNTPPAEQLVDIQSSKEIDYHDDDTPSQQYYQQQQQRESEQYQQQQQQKEIRQYQQQQEQEKEIQQYQQQQKELHQEKEAQQYQQQQQQKELQQYQQQQQQELQQQQRVYQQQSQGSQRLTPEQHYEQLVIQQRLLEQELQQRQQQLQRTQQQLYYSQQPRQQTYYNEPQVVQTQQQLLQLSHSEEPQQYRLLPYSTS